jgi:hypothetical protein
MPLHLWKSIDHCAKKYFEIKILSEILGHSCERALRHTNHFGIVSGGLGSDIFSRQVIRRSFTQSRDGNARIVPTVRPANKSNDDITSKERV